MHNVQAFLNGRQSVTSAVSARAAWTMKEKAIPLSLSYGKGRQRERGGYVHTNRLLIPLSRRSLARPSVALDPQFRAFMATHTQYQSLTWWPTFSPVFSPSFTTTNDTLKLESKKRVILSRRCPFRKIHVFTKHTSLLRPFAGDKGLLSTMTTIAINDGGIALLWRPHIIKSKSCCFVCVWFMTAPFTLLVCGGQAKALQAAKGPSCKTNACWVGLGGERAN